MMYKNKNKGYLLAIGSLSLVLSLSLGRLAVDIALINFLEGMFMGISLATNLGYLILYSLAKKTFSNEKNHIEVR